MALLSELLVLFVSSILLFLFLGLLFLPLIIVIIARVVEERQNRETYEKSQYYKSTQLPYDYAMNDTGTYGEYCTYQILERCALPNTKFLFNVYVPTGINTTTEIDIIMLSPAGIIVVESKNLGGWIFGNETQKNWCHTMRNGQKNFFYNPIMQNDAHIRHLKALIGNEYSIYSIIVFSDRCTFKDIQVNRQDVCVTYSSNVPQMLSVINNNMATRTLGESDIVALYERLFPFSQVGEETKALHLAHLYKLQLQEQRKQTEIQARNIEENERVIKKYYETGMLKCPRCNGNLVVRTAKKGDNAGKQFYGCSRYPECKYTRKI